MNRGRRRFLALLLVLTLAGGLCLAGCGGSPGRKAVVDGPPGAVPRDLASIPDAVPRDEPRSRYGNPPEYEVFGQRYRTLVSSEGFEQRGLASWYGTKFHGRRTSSGEPYDMFAMTAAHRSLPLPSFVEVTNLNNGRRVIVRVNDRGPFVAGRVIDLSYAAAYRLGMLERGVAPVLVRAAGPRDHEAGPVRVADQGGANHESIDSGEMPADDRFIQVGAFASRVAAERVQADLRDLGFDAVRITTFEAANGALHRVRIGPLVDPLAVQDATERLHQAALTDYRVVVD
ncbi:septal ring lytic transglycosylase RlpA family protein [Thioalkalivibrio nitratireducens]|nr:septal ring lytic transglycosylase RlpA family protein [Thioalkalivibrio nitratireducens]